MSSILTPPKRVLIGTLKHHPRQIVKKGYYKETVVNNAIEKQWENDQYTPAWFEWVDTGKRGLLYSFHAEGSSDGDSTVVGVVELTDGSFDTFAASCLKLETPTPNPAA